MQLPIKKLESGDLVIEVPQDLEQLLTTLKGSSILDKNGRFAEELSNLQDEIARFETPEYQQEIVQAWAAKLTPEGFVELATALGYEAHLAEATVAEVAEAEAEVGVSRLTKEMCLEVYAQLKKLLKYVTTGEDRYTQTNPYAKPAIKEALKVVAKIQGEKDYLDAELGEEEVESQEVEADTKEPAVAEGEATTEEPVIKPAIVFEDPGDPAYKWMEHLKCWVLQR